MSQPSTPAAASYLKIAAKVLQLQRALSRSKGSTTKSRDSSASNSPTSMSAPCTPTVSTFQHSNGRRLSSCNQYIHYHHHCSYSNCTTCDYHQPLHQSEHCDSPLYTLQRRCSTSGSRAQSTSKDVLVFSSTPSSKKHHRRSGPPGMYPIVSIHTTQSMIPSSPPTHSTRTRSNSLPPRRRRRISSLFQGIGISPVQQRNAENMEHPGLSVSNQGDCKNTTPSVSSTRQATATTGTSSFAIRMPLRSSTNSSMSSNGSTFSAGMRLADSSMSIQSQMSESSILSAVMTASGLPSMEVMKGQVDKSVAEDSRAQLMENVHVGVVAHISFVDNRLIAEPCSAAIETWVN